MKTITIRKKGQNPCLELRHNGNVAKIYSAEREKNAGRYAEHTLTYIEAGHRVRKVFSDLGRAKAEAEIVLEKLAAGQGQVLQLTAADRESYLIAVGELREINVPLHVAAREFRREVETLRGKGTLHDAVQFYVRHGAPDLPKKTVPEIVDALVEAKKRDELSTFHVKDLRVRLGRFAKTFTGQIGEVKASQIEEWLRALNVGPRTRNNFARAITTAFRFARKRGYLPADRSTAADNLERARVVEAKIQIFTPGEIRGMVTRLQQHRPELLPFVAIGAFAGLRHEEILRLDWSDVRLDEGRGYIHVLAENAKTGQRRLVPIQPNLAAWLLPHRKPSGPVCPLKRTQTIVKRVCRSSIEHSDGTIEPGAIAKWSNNGLRHSYASHRLPILKSAPELAMEMGNTPAMVFRHYRELVTFKQAEEYWRISPDVCGNVVAFAAQGG